MSSKQSSKSNKRYPIITLDPYDQKKKLTPEVIANLVQIEPIEEIHGKMPFKSAKIRVADPDNPNKIGDLVLRFDKCQTLGISADKYQSDEKDWKGASMFTILYNKDKNGRACPTPRQKAVVETINLVSEKCVDYLFANRQSIIKELGNNPRVAKTDSKFQSLNPLKWKTAEDGSIDEESGPSIVIKVIAYEPKKTGDEEANAEMQDEETVNDGSNIKFSTKFFVQSKNANGKTEYPEVNPRDYEKQRCQATMFVKFESIFINSSVIRLQLKLKEVLMEIQETQQRKNIFESYDDFFNDGEENTTSTTDNAEAENQDEEMEVAGGNDEDLEAALDAEIEAEFQPEPEPVPEPIVAPSDKKKRKTEKK